MKSKSILIFSVVIVAMFCVLGIFARPYPSDEYGFYNNVADKGFIQAQISYYTEWTGRIFNTFLVCLCTSFPLEKIQPFLPFINAITYIMAVFLLIGTLIPSLKSHEKLSLSFLVSAITLCFTFSLHETFYWIPGMPYFWTGTLLFISTALAIRAFRGSRMSFILCIIVLFLNATLLEQPCVFQGIIAFLAMLYFAYRGEKARAFMAGAFWLVSVAGFCAVYFAPGTAVRTSALNYQTVVPTTTKILRGFLSAFSLGVLNTFQFFAKPIIYTVIFFLPSIADNIPAFDERLSRRLKAWHIVVIVAAIAMFMQYMMGVIGGGGLPERGVSLSLWLMFFTWVMLWVFVYRGRLIRSEGFRKVCVKLRWPVLIVSVIISANFTECLSAFRTAPQYDAEWQARIDSILSQRRDGITNLAVPPLKTKPALIASEVNPLASWSGPSLARYYGAENLYLIPEGLAGNPEDVAKLMSGNLEPYAKLAENGDTNAMFRIGHYRNPRIHSEKPETKNLDEALKYYTMGAEAGNLQCMRFLSRLLMTRDFLKAVYWQIKFQVLITRI